MRTLFYCLLSSLLIFATCKKDKDRTYCWRVFDQLGNPMGEVCGKTETEIQEQYGNFYDRADAPTFCWLITRPGQTQPSYAEDLTVKMLEIWHSGSTAVKVPCGYCAKWMSREKLFGKASGQFVYSSISTRQYCGDTLQTIFAGRTFILRETPDSIIYHEFIGKQ